MKAITIILSMLISISSFGQTYSGKSTHNIYSCDLIINHDSTISFVIYQKDKTTNKYILYLEFSGFIKKISPTKYKMIAKSKICEALNEGPEWLKNKFMISDTSKKFDLKELVFLSKDGTVINKNFIIFSKDKLLTYLYIRGVNTLYIDRGYINPISREKIIFLAVHQGVVDFGKWTDRTFTLTLNDNSIKIKDNTSQNEFDGNFLLSKN